MNYVKKLNLHWYCTQNHILEPFSVRCACTKSYVTSEPYPRASQIWCQNVRETWKKKVIKCRGESFCALQSNRAKCRGGVRPPPPPVFLGLNMTANYMETLVMYKPSLCVSAKISPWSVWPAHISPSQRQLGPFITSNNVNYGRLSSGWFVILVWELLNHIQEGIYLWQFQCLEFRHLPQTLIGSLLQSANQHPRKMSRLYTLKLSPM